MFNIKFHEDKLASYLSQDRFARLNVYFQTEIENLETTHIANRKSVLDSAAMFAKTYAGNTGAPSILLNAGVDNTASAQEVDYANADLQDALDWFERIEADCYCMSTTNRAEKQNSNIQSKCDVKCDVSVKAPSNKVFINERASLGSLLPDRIRKIMDNERGAFLDVRENAPGLQPLFSFEFLYHEGSGWIIELVFWTWFGVLASAMAGLFDAIKLDNYKPQVFALTIPKLLLAPVLALVVVALWAAGFTETKVSLSNLPFFLAVAFALGFGHDRVIRLIRSFVKGVLGGLAFSTKRLAEQERQMRPYRSKYDLDVPTALPSTISELRRRAKDVAKAEMEKSLVSS